MLHVYSFSLRLEEGTKSPRSEFTGGCDLSDRDVGNQTLVLFKQYLLLPAQPSL